MFVNGPSKCIRMEDLVNLQICISSYLASRIKDRHILLLGAIGVFDEEEHAYQLATEFSWILPTVVLCGGLVDILLIVFYMKFAHPWKDILSKEQAWKTDGEPKEVGQVSLIGFETLNRFSE